MGLTFYTGRDLCTGSPHLSEGLLFSWRCGCNNKTWLTVGKQGDDLLWRSKASAPVWSCTRESDLKHGSVTDLHSHGILTQTTRSRSDTDHRTCCRQECELGSVDGSTTSSCRTGRLLAFFDRVNSSGLSKKKLTAFPPRLDVFTRAPPVDSGKLKLSKMAVSERRVQANNSLPVVLRGGVQVM